MNGVVSYINPRTGGRWSSSHPLWRAPDDGGVLELEPGQGLRRQDVDTSERSLWRYEALLPTRTHEGVRAGWTPLERADSLSELPGVALLLIDADVTVLPTILRRIIADFESVPWSAGVASYPKSGNDPGELLAQADSMLLQAERDGGSGLGA